MIPFSIFQTDSYRLFCRKRSEIDPDVQVLDAAEMKRYQRIVFEDKKDAFLAGRTFLKSTLSQYLDVPPKAIALAYTTQGKPYLPAIYGEQALFFNMSHAKDYYLMGVSSKPIGVDIEYKRDIDHASLRHFFSSCEWQALQQFPDTKRSQELLKLFTLKEAFLKASDKQWKLDEIAFQFQSNKWKLLSPSVPCSFFTTEMEKCHVSICLYEGFS